MNPPKRRGCVSVIGYLVILFAAVAVAAPSSGRGLPPTVNAQSGAPTAWIAQLVEHRRYAAQSAGSEVAGSSPAPWVGAPTSTPTAPRLPGVTGANDGALAEPRTASEPIAPSGEHPATRQGTWAYAKPSYGPRYLAIPEGPGILVTVCGPADCLDRVSTDAGPELYLQRTGRIGDLSSVDFEAVCGVPVTFGLCPGSYTIHDGADARMRAEVLGDELYPTLPPTDATGGTP